MIYKILTKLKIISKLPREIAKPLLKLIIAFDEIFWRFRIFLFTLFLPKKNKFKKAFIELKNTGVSVIPNFYSNEETSNIKNECIKELDKLPFDKLATDDYISNLNLGNGLRVEKLKFLEGKVEKIYVTCKKGDLLLIDLKTAHSATSLKSGQRHILWYYY